MSALHARLSGQPGEAVISLLNDAVDAHFKSVRGLIFGYDYLIKMNPDFVVKLVKEYLLYAPNTPTNQGKQICVIVFHSNSTRKINTCSLLLIANKITYMHVECP